METKPTEATKTAEYFYSQASEFRKLMGEKTFWELSPEGRDLMFGGLTLCYLRFEHKSKEEHERVIALFSAICEEYSRRTAYMLTRG